MNVLMLTSSYPKYPGETTAPFIEEIAAGLARRGHNVHVVAPYHRDVRRAPVERGVHLHFFPYSPIAALNVWGYAESLHADVSLRGQTLLAAPLALTASVWSLLRLTDGLRGRASRSGPRAAVSQAPFDLIHAHWILPNGVPAAVAARWRHLPLVISLHGSDVFLAERAPLFSVMAAGTMRAAARVTACSRDLQDRALRLGARAGTVDVVPYGADPRAFQPDPAAAAAVRAELGIPPTAPLIVTMSRLVYKKGLTYLIDCLPAVLARHPDAVLVLAGYGDLREQLEHQTRDLGLAAHVRFPGQIDRERAARYIAAADVYPVPSIRDQRGNIDGLPNALLEGMGAGQPIVASRIAGIPDVIDDGVHGLLVPERDAPALAAAINRLLDDRPFARRMGAAARERILHELTWDATAERIEKIYQSVVNYDGQ
jgi:glycosyltransferase involved in cell wall biosynthesis